ncbi:MAG TPA: hypothetical protein VGH28_32820 [Polyangiaceae bacterium]|jgi:hypothetical protein
MRFRHVVLPLIFASLPACMQWAPVADPSDVGGASRVRVVADDRPPVVLDHPSVQQVRALVAGARNAHVELRRLDGLGTALIITAAALATLGTAAIILAIAVGHGSG